MNILLADDHDLVRDGITSFLKIAAPEVEVAQAKDFAEALAVVDGETDNSMPENKEKAKRKKTKEKKKIKERKIKRATKKTAK